MTNTRKGVGTVVLRPLKGMFTQPDTLRRAILRRRMLIQKLDSQIKVLEAKLKK